MLIETIQQDLTQAMKSKEEKKVSTLRFLIAALKNEQIATKKEHLDDEEVRKVIQRQVKQHADSIAQYRAGNRIELALKEEEEMIILRSYLPSMMSEEEVRKVVEEKKTALGITDTSGMGRLMGEVMKELKGKADGGVVKKMVEETLTT
jgi:uncharacterized protein YqeY